MPTENQRKVMRSASACSVPCALIAAMKIAGLAAAKAWPTSEMPSRQANRFERSW